MDYQTIGKNEHGWSTKTYEEVAEIAESDGSILVVPVGSIEQHGHHLPVSTDTILVDAVANLGAERVIDSVPILVTPPVWSGYSPHHMPFGGTLTLKLETLLAVLENIADASLENGFDGLLLLNGHGGNASLIDNATSIIGAKHPNVEVLGLTYYQLAASFIDEIRESDVGGMGHAGEFETSLMMHLRPDLVYSDKLEGTNLKEPYDLGIKDLFVGGPLAVYRTFDEYSESGAIGDPNLATPEKGAEIYARLGDEMEELLWDIHERNR